jgi:hypothetical protein
MASSQKWSSRELERQINVGSGPTALLLEPKPIRSRTKTNSLQPGTALDGRSKPPVE